MSPIQFKEIGRLVIFADGEREFRSSLGIWITKHLSAEELE